jgi:deazaflavin-dependent oxidoreductase (nitroreductase family)
MPLCVCADGDDLVIAASAGGQPAHPQWYRNLEAHPGVVVEYLGRTFQAVASTEPNGPRRDRLFAALSNEIRGLYEYQDRCRDQRQIPIIRLTPVQAVPE